MSIQSYIFWKNTFFLVKLLFHSNICYSSKKRSQEFALDKKLLFKMHIDNKIVETKQKLGYTKQRIWATHCSTCDGVKYACDTGAVPTFTYAAHIWAHKLTKKHKLEMIDINRMACKLIAPQVGRAPTNGLEVILGIVPMELNIEAAAVNIYLNIEGTYDTFWGGTNKKSKKCNLKCTKNGKKCK